MFLSLPERVDETKITVQKLQGLPPELSALSMDVLRADLLHPVISGNKWFKLKYHLQEAVSQGCRGLITCGGPFSNHLHATSFAAQRMQWPSVLVVRGNTPVEQSPTLQDCVQMGSRLVFLDRSRFRDKAAMQQAMRQQFPGYYFIPEGGCSALGIRGASDMLAHIPLQQYSHICCAVGTGTMISGLAAALSDEQTLIGIPVLRIHAANDHTIAPFILQHAPIQKVKIIYGYHAGGYARHTPGLIAHMNEMFDRHRIPLDFVYTGKLFNAIFSLARTPCFPKGSRLLLIHSGGLQGNRSLEKGVLAY